MTVIFPVAEIKTHKEFSLWVFFIDKKSV